jgi:hypothetical protein
MCYHRECNKLSTSATPSAKLAFLRVCTPRSRVLHSTHSMHIVCVGLTNDGDVSDWFLKLLGNEEPCELQGHPCLITATDRSGWFDISLVAEGQCDLLLFFSCGASIQFRVMASSYGASRSHSDTPHSIVSSGTVSSRSQSPLPDNIQYSTDKYPCLRQDSNLQSQQASGLRPRGHWQRPVAMRIVKSRR